eukprot:scaffold385_cov305-Pinguiococcus_pyrenoidosus.AAC.17
MVCYQSRTWMCDGLGGIRRVTMRSSFVDPCRTAACPSPSQHSSKSLDRLCDMSTARKRSKEYHKEYG